MRATDLLDRYLAEERTKPFAWGQGNGDCLLFVLGWLEMAGRRSGTAWRGSYADEVGARRKLDRFGGAVAAVCDVLGPPRMGSSAERGDVGLLEVDGWHLGLVCTGRLWALRDGRRGIGFVRRPVDLVWRVA